MFVNIRIMQLCSVIFGIFFYNFFNNDVIISSLVSCQLSAQEIVNWVTTADGCVHTADATRQFRLVGVGGVYWALEAG